MLSSLRHPASLLQRSSSSSTAAPAVLRRRLSSIRLPSNNIRSSLPNYTVFGEKSMLNLRVILPEFKLTKSNYLVLDTSRKGRILLEWTPRMEGGGVNRDAQIRFGLSAEEVGFLLHQLPDNEVEFSRKIGAYTVGMSGQVADDLPDKVMRITPKEGFQFQFHVDFEKDGVGGQTPDHNSPPGPMEVTAQLGEWQVIQQLMQATIPALVGWDAQLSIAVQNSVDAALRSGYQSDGPGPSPY